MRWTSDLTGAEPIVRDMPVYDGSDLRNGELLMKGTTTDGTVDGAVSLITAYNATPGSSAIDTVGILQESTYESSGTEPSRTWANTSGVYYGKVIINPFAVYRAEILQDTGNDVAVESSSTTVNIYETIATADEAIGCYIYFTHSSASAAIEGSLRMITDNETTYAVVPALKATPTTSDLYIIIQPPHQYPLNLDTNAVGISSLETLTDVMTNADSGGATNLRIVETWIESPSVGMCPLRGYKDADSAAVWATMDGLDSSTKFYHDIIMKDHLFGVQEA